MENNEKLLLLNERLQKNAEKIELAKEKVTALEAEGKKIEFDRMQLVIGDYLPIINELELSPAEFRELLQGFKSSEPVAANEYESEVNAYEQD